MGINMSDILAGKMGWETMVWLDLDSFPPTICREVEPANSDGPTFEKQVLSPELDVLTSEEKQGSD